MKRSTLVPSRQFVLVAVLLAFFTYGVVTRDWWPIFFSVLMAVVTLMAARSRQQSTPGN